MTHRSKPFVRLVGLLLLTGLLGACSTTFRGSPWNAPVYASFGFRDWDPAEAPASIAKALRNEAANGLSDRCAMVMEL